MAVKDDTKLCRKCGAPIPHSTVDGECYAGHMRPGDARELEESELSEIERRILARLGYQFEEAA